jgi:chromosome segregation ATPase
MTEDYDALKKRIDKIEYTDIKNLNDELIEVRLDMREHSILATQTVETLDKLSDTMDSFKSTMIEITHSLKESNKEVANLGRTVDSLEDKVNRTNDKMDERFNELKSKVESVDDKGKVDLVLWCKTNWYKLAISLGLLGILLGEIFGKNPLF